MLSGGGNAWAESWGLSGVGLGETEVKEDLPNGRRDSFNKGREVRENILSQL